jgi:hypothetical protein
MKPNERYNRIKDSDYSPIRIVGELLDVVDTYKGSSLPEYTSSTRLSPMTMIDKKLTLMEGTALQNILQTMLSIYTAHYLQAISLMTKVNGVETIELLDRFSTDPKLGDFIYGKLKGSARGTESIALLPSMEEEDTEVNMPVTANMPNKVNLDDSSNLAVGKLVHVHIGVGTNKVTIPVTVALSPKVIDSNVLPDVLAMTDVDTSFMGRYHQWRAGEIESFIDFVFATDLIEKDRKALLNDKSGVYKTLRERNTSGSIKNLITGKASVNMASAMAVVDKSTSEELEYALKGKLKSAKVRQRYFENTYSMMLVVVDTRAERLTIHQRGIADSGLYTFDDIKNASKKTNAIDIDSILKAYKLGESPTL